MFSSSVGPGSGLVRAVLFASVLSCALSGACSSDEASPDAAADGPVVDGTASFNAMVKPLLNGCVGCHANGVNEPNLTSFQALGARYKAKPGRSNILVTKADSAGGMHYGNPYLDVDGKRIVASWIDSLP